MELNHINDCWEYLTSSKNIDELNERLDEMPKWSGSWDLVFIKTVEQEPYSYDEYEIINIVDDMNEEKETIYFASLTGEQI